MANFTTRQLEIIQRARRLLPDNFSRYTNDEKVLAYAEVILADINLFPPLTGYTTEDLPDSLLPVLDFGITVMTELFLQARATLQDFSYNDNGLSISIQQVPNLDVSYKNMLELYRNMITNYKKTEVFRVGGKGLGTPRFQSQIGQFLKISLGSSFTWNSP